MYAIFRTMQAVAPTTAAHLVTVFPAFTHKTVKYLTIKTLAGFTGTLSIGYDNTVSPTTNDVLIESEQTDPLFIADPASIWVKASNADQRFIVVAVIE